MSWRFTEDVAEYADAAGPLLAADPAMHTISLTVIENARARTRAAHDPELFGWWTDPGGTVAGAVSHTPPHGLLLGVVPEEAIPSLVDGLYARRAAGRRLPEVNGPTALAAQFAAVWAGRTGERAVLEDAQRLYRLMNLAAPEPAPPGRARLAAAEDVDLVTDWMRAFAHETGGSRLDPDAAVAERLGYGGLLVWEDQDGAIASLAGVSRIASGVARIGPVYTPPCQRGRGWAAAATAAATRAALRRGAREVVLFTQLDNPTSNRLYQRLGYRPVTDRMLLAFEPPS